ncbi:hypothetical protein AKO1_014327 [Acrasis kona]|uniref:Uncharacterized protein n=1 Tax=Acrasis kona TaxID=1008807 RepID=A0AAW2Z235_9EUKA
MFRMISRSARHALRQAKPAQCTVTSRLYSDVVKKDGELQPQQTQQPEGEERPIVRLYDVNPNPTIRSWAQTMQPSRPGDKHFLNDLWINNPQQWESAVGSERAELIDPNMWNDLLPEIIDIESGDGSSFDSAIVITSQYDDERTISCYGACYDGDLQDFDEVEPQYWIMKTGTFSVCTSCSLHFYLAHPLQLEKWKLDQYVQKEFGKIDAAIKPLSEAEVVQRIEIIKKSNKDLIDNDDYLRQVVIENYELDENEKMLQDATYKFYRYLIDQVARELQEEDVQAMFLSANPEVQQVLEMTNEEFVKTLKPEVAEHFNNTLAKVNRGEITMQEAIGLARERRAQMVLADNEQTPKALKD